MKYVRLATVAVLSTTLFAGGAQVLAKEAREVTTDGQVEFIPNDTDETEVEPPETGPDVTIPPVGPDGQTGPLTIAYAPTLDFGQQVISNQDQAYNLVAEMQTLTSPEEDGPTKAPYVSFAQVQDTRGTNAGWDLRVALSNFTAEDTQNDTLTGAQIEFLSPRLQYNGNNPDNAPAVHANSLKLEAGGDAQSVLSARARTGAGTSSVVWGNQADLNAQFADEDIEIVENDFVKLHVPGATVKDAVMYTATLDWELNDVPGMTGETI